MGFAPVYLAYRLWYRVAEFFRHWYVDGSRAFASRFVSTLETLDRTFAVAINLRHLTEPLYGDYTAVGHLLGPLFRIQRIVTGIALYLAVGALFLTVYAAWVALPLGAIVYGLTTLR